MNYKKINVLIVTYKQADVIGRNLDSILQQKEYGLNEIVICDDCSPDNNWEVIQSYVEKYPSIIRAYRNNPNLGIYGNSNKLMSLRGDADLYCWLEGDDALCPDFFENAQKYITNYSTEGCKCFLAGYKIISPTGRVSNVPNDFLKTGKNPFGSWMRGLVSWRAGLFTRGVVDEFQPAIIDRGLSLAESSFDGQWFLHTNTFMSMPFYGTIYYSGIGVSVNLGVDSTYLKEDSIIKWNYFKKIVSDETDKCYIEYNIALAQFLISPNLLKIPKLILNKYKALKSYTPFGVKEFFYTLKSMLGLYIRIKKNG